MMQAGGLQITPASQRLASVGSYSFFYREIFVTIDVTKRNVTILFVTIESVTFDVTNKIFDFFL